MHGERFAAPPGAVRLAEGFVLRRDGTFSRIDMAFRYRDSYGLQFEPQLTVSELAKWNAEFAADLRADGRGVRPARGKRAATCGNSPKWRGPRGANVGVLREMAGTGGENRRGFRRRACARRPRVRGVLTLG